MVSVSVTAASVPVAAAVVSVSVPAGAVSVPEVPDAVSVRALPVPAGAVLSGRVAFGCVTWGMLLPAAVVAVVTAVTVAAVVCVIWGSAGGSPRRRDTGCESPAAIYAVQICCTARPLSLPPIICA